MYIARDELRIAEGFLDQYDEMFVNDRYAAAQAAAQAAQAKALIVIARELQMINDRAESEAEQEEVTLDWRGRPLQ